MPDLQKLGQFNLLEEIGHGGMGAVFRAFDPILNREVALKLLRAELSQDPKFLDDFLREARAAAAISHPHIVQIHSVETEDGQSFIVMELLKGRTLREIIEKDGPLNEERALDLAINVTEALRAAYKNSQMIHGDIKPANIFVTEELGAKVLDFGLAKLANVEAPSGTEIWGSPYYISPERVGQKAEDFRSDVYSLGATLFHALAGRPPFDAETPVELAAKRLSEKPPLLREINPNLTGKTEQVVNKMLNKNILLRYVDYDAVLDDLREAKTEATAKRLGVSLHPERTPSEPQDREPVSAPRGSKLPLVLGVAVVAVIVAGVIVKLTIQPKPQPQPKPPVATSAPPAVVKTSAPPVEVPKPPPGPTPEELEAKRRAEEARRKEEEERRKAEAEKRKAEEERQRRMQAETNLVIVADAEVGLLRDSYDFAALLARYELVAPQMTFPGTKRLARQRVTIAERLVKFKAQIIADLPRAPYRRGDLITTAGNPISGALSGATNAKVTLTNPYGKSEIEWSEMTPQSLSKLAQFYIDTPPPGSPTSVAERRLTLAVFFKQYGFPVEAAKQVQAALELEPTLRDEIILIWGKVPTVPKTPGAGKLATPDKKAPGVK